MIEINEPKVVAQKQYIGEPQITIYGLSIDGTRAMQVVMRVTNENNAEIGTITKIYSGSEFNDAYTAYASDKGLLTYIAENSTEIPIENIEQMPENLENTLQVQPVKEQVAPSSITS